MTAALIALSCLFALVHGLNTGAALVATSLAMRALSVITALLVMGFCVGIAPFLLGTVVATRLANELVHWGPGEESIKGMLIAVSVTIAVIMGLSVLRIPSSMTLALVGAITGFGLSSGSPVAWHSVVLVLVMMAVAPLLGAFGSVALSKLMPLLPRGDADRRLQRAHVVGFSVLSLAYGSNDAQKMIAVLAIATGTAATGVSAIWWQVLSMTGLFVIGSALGLSRMSSTMSRGVVLARPGDVVNTEFGAAGAMLVSTVVGAPVGLAQTLSGALVGSGASQGLRRVRWQQVSKILVAWIVTLPLSLGLAALVGWIVA